LFQQLYEARSKQSEEELKVAQLKAQLQVSSTSSEGKENGGGGVNLGGGGGGGEVEGGVGGESSSAASTPTPPNTVSRIDENDAKLIGKYIKIVIYTNSSKKKCIGNY
jgi:hypothetical protein